MAESTQAQGGGQADENGLLFQSIFVTLDEFYRRRMRTHGEARDNIDREFIGRIQRMHEPFVNLQSTEASRLRSELQALRIAAQEREAYFAGVEAEVSRLRGALEGMLNRYVGLVESGDAGNWDAESEEEVIAARAALAPQAPASPSGSGFPELSDEVKAGLRLIRRSYIYTNFGPIGAAQDWIEKVLSTSGSEIPKDSDHVPDAGKVIDRDEAEMEVREDHDRRALNP